MTTDARTARAKRMSAVYPRKALLYSLSARAAHSPCRPHDCFPLSRPQVPYSPSPFLMSRKIRYGMVGGGRGAFIGAVHRIAANIDGQIELVCGAFSSDPEKSKASGADLFLPPDSCYGTYEEMIQKEKALPAD